MSLMDELWENPGFYTLYIVNGYALYAWHWVQYSGDSDTVHKTEYYRVIMS